MYKILQKPQNLVYMDYFVFKLDLIIYIFARATHSGVSCAKTIVLATATRKSCVLPRAKLVFCFANRAENLCYQNKTDKTSCRNFARLSAWWVRLWRKRNIVHRRGNGNTQILRIAESQTCFLLFYRAPLLKRHCGEINRSHCHSEE